jgi:hypothetical protein
MTSTYIALFASLSLSLLALPGCGSAATGEEDVGSARSAELSDNALAINALAINALAINSLSDNALAINALAINALAINALDPGAAATIEDPSAHGDLARELLSYTVGCALNPSQSFTFSYTDASGVVQTVTDVGMLGLYPEWVTRPLTDVGKQQDISACLAARTNYFGIVVHISVRGVQPALLDSTPPSELAAYPYVEGAFWGNLFASTPSLYACYDPANAANSNADNRVCATGYTEADGQVAPCGMITLTGPCDEQCDWFDEQAQLYLGCGDSRTHSITIGLE